MRSKADLDARLAQLPRFYTHHDVVDQVFAGDEDQLVDAWVQGLLPQAVRLVIWEGGAQWLNTLLLARLCRLQFQILIQITHTP